MIQSDEMFCACLTGRSRNKRDLASADPGRFVTADLPENPLSCRVDLRPTATRLRVSSTGRPPFLSDYIDQSVNITLSELHQG